MISVTRFVEMAAIVLQTVRGERSHFNEETSFDAMIFSIMGATIVVLWFATLVVSVLLWISPGADRARALAVRLGATIALIGLGLGFLMVLPTEQQLLADTGIIGAHTVGADDGGADDGGAGIPLLGWSTEHGDLRIPHFIGMHALQIIPLALIVIELLAHRVPTLRFVGVRVGLVWTAASVHLAVTALVTWQALRGQSIVQPDALSLWTAGAIAVGGALAAAASLRRRGAHASG